MQILAHRGATEYAPANTMPAFQRALDLGADAIECDVRLTRDHVPVLAHFFAVHDARGGTGPVFSYHYADIRTDDANHLPTLDELLKTFAGRIGLEIEIKGPEPESAVIVAAALQPSQRFWESIEVTSSEPILLREMQMRCPGLATDLLFPRSEPWMTPEIVRHLALHRARLANARAIHLHPTQLLPNTVAAIRAAGIAVHAWDVNDAQALATATALHIPRICTDRLDVAVAHRCQHRFP
ncbi:MAG: glycerophosphodiester phosphodiesterase [Thermomicrobiales bacterium]